MEFAVIQTGGKQYKVKAGDTIRIEKLYTSDREKIYKEGDKIVFDKVLLVDNGTDTTIGTPFIDKAKVTGTLVKIGRAAKIDVIHFF